MECHFRDLLRSDHYSFWKRDLPAIMLTDTADQRSPHYHEPSDTADTLNMEFARKVCLGNGAHDLERIAGAILAASPVG